MEPVTTDDCLRTVLGDDKLVERIRGAKILLVGAGGIGCEVIKTMVLSGFKHFNVIDLDTIDVSNLNRQFLFNKTHVGQSKAQVACTVAKDRFAHFDADGYTLTAILDPVQNQEFNVDFFKSHSIVINALDNIAARAHVNRMCLAANVSLIESGTEGYVGQVFMIQKGVSACYECDGPRQAGKTYASCTIRNTPSLPIHCIVWGKHLFAQLFGESDPDNDVSPDVNDPELQTNGNGPSEHNGIPNNGNGDSKNGNGDTNGQAVDNGEVASAPKLPSTRFWAESNNYDPKLLFEKLFDKDVQYLLKMDKLWESRPKPIPLSFSDLTTETPIVASTVESTTGNSGQESDLEDQKLWSLQKCYDKFSESIKVLRERINPETPFLVWDKDDEPALDFVTAVSNLRSKVFAIEQKSLFDVKSMAGNIIPAISSTNAVIGGLITLQAIEILSSITEDGKMDSEKLYQNCRHAYLKTPSTTVNNLVASYELSKPNPKCYVCADSREVKIQLNLSEVTLGQFVNDIILTKLGFVCPDIVVDGTSTMIWSKDEADEEEPDEKVASNARILADFTLICSGVRLKVDDLIQKMFMIVTLEDSKIDPSINDGMFYKLIVTSEGKTEEAEEKVASEQVDTSEVFTVDEGDDLMVVDAIATESKNGTTTEKLKRGSEDVTSLDSPVKKLRT